MAMTNVACIRLWRFDVVKNIVNGHDECGLYVAMALI